MLICVVNLRNSLSGKLLWPVIRLGIFFYQFIFKFKEYFMPDKESIVILKYSGIQSGHKYVYMVCFLALGILYTKDIMTN